MEKPSIDLRRLRYFIAVCEHSGFSRASSFIGIAQPALTRQIKLLEQEIGIPLIHRTARGAQPTEAGRLLLNKSRQYLSGLDDLIWDIKNSSCSLNGQISLGICPTIAPFFLDEIIRHVHEHYPDVKLKVVQAHSGDLLSLMARKVLDLVLTYHAGNSSAEGYIDLFSERLVAATGYVAGKNRKSVKLRAMKGKRLILPSRVHAFRQVIDETVGAQGFRIEHELEFDCLDAIKALLEDRGDEYWTILPFVSITQECRDRRISAFSLREPELRRTIALVVSPGTEQSRQSFLIDYIRIQAARVRARGSGPARIVPLRVV